MAKLSFAPRMKTASWKVMKTIQPNTKAKRIAKARVQRDKTRSLNSLNVNSYIFHPPSFTGILALGLVDQGKDLLRGFFDTVP